MELGFWPAVVVMAAMFGLYSVLETGIRNWRKARIVEQNAVLKKTMIDKGFSPQEIVSVIEAGERPSAKMAEV